MFWVLHVCHLFVHHQGLHQVLLTVIVRKTRKSLSSKLSRERCPNKLRHVEAYDSFNLFGSFFWVKNFQGIMPHFLVGFQVHLLENKLKPVKDEFMLLLETWCKQKLGRSILDSEQLVLNNPMAMFSDFHGFYLANRKEARLFCVEFWVLLFTNLSLKLWHGSGFPGPSMGE